MKEDFISLSKEELIKIDEKYGWSLNIAELIQAQNYFRKLKRNPTRAEMETIAQTWSEHCKHKTFSGPVKLIYGNKVKRFKNLFKETIVYSTKKLNKKWCLSVFKDNAGIVELARNSKWAVAFKAETHNHPCAIEPYGGAETGVGGVIRDILGVGLGAKPVLNTDNFCFGPLDKKVPGTFLSPRKIFEGVVEGVRDYGNRMGIPTASGGIYFDEGYTYNPLVYVGCVGIIPKDKICKKVKKGDLIVAIGGPTGRDGIHGATFSSADITEETSSSAVQIGHAINEKKVLDVIMKARDLELYNAITDCGAGGFSSAIGELGAGTGAEVKLESAILKDKNIQPWEIWISESQERMVLSVPENNLKKLKEICEIENCPLCVLGKFDGSKKLKVYYKNERLIDIDMNFLHGGIPKFEKKAICKERKKIISLTKNNLPYGKLLKKVLSDENVCSRCSVIIQYDHEVQGGTIVKPFSGKMQSSPTDAVVIWPHAATGEINNFSGFAVSHGFAYRIGKISPYLMPYYAIDEAIRNLVCVGADINKTALLDNFCCGNPNNPFILGDFVMSALGTKDAAVEYKTPFISGKDSFYNQSKIDGKEYSIPVSLLISAIAPVKDVRKVISSDFKTAGNPVYIVGLSKKGLGGSVYAEIFNENNNVVAEMNVDENLKLYSIIKKAIEKGFIISAHDVSDGGFAATICEMCFNGIGVEIYMDDIPVEKGITETEILFGENGSRIVIEVVSEKEREFRKLIGGQNISKIGYINEESTIEIRKEGNILFKENIFELKEIWDKTL